MQTTVFVEWFPVYENVINENVNDKLVCSNNVNFSLIFHDENTIFVR